MGAPIAPVPLRPGEVEITYRVVVLPSTCHDHVLLWACEQLLDERCSGEDVPWPPDGYAMASDIFAEAESWLDDHHEHSDACANCPDCHPAEVSA